MPERFNFYDLYGYLIPGMVFLAMLWLPWGLTAREWPDLQLSSAFVFLIAAYVVGVLLNRVITSFVSLKVYDGEQSKDLNPSEILIGTAPARARELLGVTMSADFRTRFSSAFTQTFGGLPATDESTYYLARGMIQAKSASYAEQLQGMYTMCQILTGVCVLAACYFLGWSFPRPVQSLSAVLFGAGLVGLFVHYLFSSGKWTFLFLCVMSLFGGSVLASTPGTGAELRFAGLALAATVLTLPFLAAFEHFRGLHAVAVYQAFYVWHCARGDENADKKGADVAKPRGR